MIRPSARWCALIGLSLLWPAGSVWAAAQDTAAAQAAASAALQQFGSADAIREHAALPLTSGNSQLSTIDGSKSASVPISNPSSAAFLSVAIVPLATGDLSPVRVSQDLDFDGVMEYSYQPPFVVSGICANGVISCDAGTWNHCQSYQWQADNSGRVTLQPTSLDTLAGCYCINQSCGGGAGNPQAMLKDLGGAVVKAVQGQQSGASISRVDLTNSTISYYGQNNSGSPTGNLAQSGYAAQPQNITTDTAAAVNNQAADPNSLYSMVTTSFTNKGAASDLHSCTVSRSVSLNEVDLADIIVPQGGTGAVQVCGTDCIRVILGKVGDNYWGGFCAIYERDYQVLVKRPELIKTATLVQAIWDDYIQVWVHGTKVYNGPNNNFPPETAGPCELGTSWNTHPNLDVTSYFKQAGIVDSKIRVSVAGLGEGYAYIEVRVNNLCQVLPDVITDNCQALAADHSCQIQDETVDGVQTWQSFNPTGKDPLPSTKLIIASPTCSQEITRDWWQQKRTYRCTRNNDFDFTDAGKRVDTITRSLDSNTLNQTTFDYTDTRQNQATGAWTTDNQAVAINAPEPTPDCEFVCKTRKPVQDSQVSLTGVSTDYQNSPTRYDTFYHVCVNNNTCPAGPGEVIAEDCQCLNEFAEAASAMMVLDEASHDMVCSGGGTTGGGDCVGEIKIFNGHGNECLQNGWDTTFFNCCNDSVGNFLIFKEHCPDASLETVQAMQAGRTHFIGSYCKRDVVLIGCVQDADVYCLFNSKLGRIIQEQGRLQLQRFAPDGRWGTAESPNCEGFTPEEFQMLDFSRIDLSDMFGDLAPVSEATVQGNANKAVNDFQNRLQ